MIQSCAGLVTRTQQNMANLLLFDIDGTLVSTHGIPRQAMSTVLKRRFPGFVYDTGYNFSGRTDWEIVEHLLRFDKRPVDDALVHNVLEEFAAELDIVLKNGRHPLIYPGVISLLEILQQMSSVSLGLVTGNIEEGARIKLRRAGLDHFFQVGGFGNDSNNRDDLPPLAIARAEEYFNRSFERKNIWVIGDSLFDIRCAKNNDLRSLAVATGWTDYEDLKSAGPDHITRDFSDVKSIVDILTI